MQTAAVLEALLSPDNARRQQAEAAFAQMRTQPEQLVSEMMLVLTTSTNTDIRGLVAVLLRSNIFTKLNSAWESISAPLQQRVKSALLNMMAAENVAATRHKLIDTTCELAGHIFNRAEQNAPDSGPQQWPELLQFVFQASQHAQPGHRDTGLRIFTRLSAFLGPLIKGPHLATMKQIFARGLVDADLTVRMSALSATISFVELHFDEQTKKETQQALPKMAEIITAALAANNEQDARAAVGMFVELAEADPLFFRPQIGPLCQMMAGIIASTALEDVTRQYALEFLVTLCEQKPGMMAKVPGFFPQLLKMCVMLLLEMEHDNDWFTRSADAVELTNADVAAECLDRLCLALTGKVVFPLFQQMLPVLLKSPQWKQRYAGLQVICIMGEGCNDEVAETLPGLVQMLVPFFQDEHPRVRYTAFNTFGQLCTDFGPTLQEELHAMVLPMLLHSMETEKVPKVLAHCCACTVNWCHGLDPVHLTPYLNRWMTALQNVLSSGPLMAQEQALVALAALAECLQTAFTPFYDAFMPVCKALMGRVQGNKELREMAGKCIDAITVMAAAVGAQKFAPDGAHILPAMVALQQTKMDDDDPMINHLMQGWARVCKCLQEGFVPYLPVVMPSLLASANRKPDVQLANSENAEALQNEGTWDFRTIANESFACKTSAMEEKALAVNMIFCYAYDLKEHFMPYVSDSVAIVVPLLDFYLDNMVRSAAAGVVPKLLNCVVRHVKAQGGAPTLITSLWMRVFPTLLESINAEPDVRTLVDKVECLKECLAVLGPGCINAEQLSAALRVFMGVVLSVLERKHRIMARQDEEDFDEVEGQMLYTENEFNEQLLMTASDLHCQLIKTLPEAYMQCLPSLAVSNRVLLKLILQMADTPITTTDLQIAICMMDDVIEFGGPGSTALYQQFMPLLIKHMEHAEAEVRQAAVYGIGVFFEVAPAAAVNAGMLNTLLRKLNTLVTAKKARTKRNAPATENAISAFGKALEFRADLIQDDKGAVETWIGYLPVTKDKVEARVTYARLLRFLAQNRKHIWGVDLALLPNILHVLVLVANSKLVTADMQPQVIAALKAIKAMPQPAVQAAVARLDAAMKKKLAELAL